MKPINILVLFTYFILALPLQANTFVIIRGPVSCGKSTLCKALKNLDNSYIIISQDNIHTEITYEICKNIFPTEMAIISKAIKYENIVRAIKYLEIILQEEINEQEMQSLMDALKRIRNYFDDPAQEKQLMAMMTLVKNKVMEKILFNATRGYNVIFDAWGKTTWNYELEQLKECFDHTISVVAYCSLETVINRWNKRNTEAIKTNDLTDRRILCQMLSSFFGILTPTPIDQNGSLIITKKEFDLLMHTATEHIKDLNHHEKTTPPFSCHEFTLEELSAFKENMYTKFNFNCVDQVALIPSVSYDIMLCTEGDYNKYAPALLQQIKSFN